VIESWEMLLFMYIMQLQTVMLQLHLRHGFYNIVFKIKHILYIALGSEPPLAPTKNSGCAPAVYVTLNGIQCKVDTGLMRGYRHS